MIKTVLQSVSIHHESVKLFIPDATAVLAYYESNKEAAYWAQVWPAAIGLCIFLQGHPDYIRDRKVIELAAGLGLPGIYAASKAKQVLITEREPIAINCINQTITLHAMENVTCEVMDWNDATEIDADVLLLSDVNYDPRQFEELQDLIEELLNKGTTVIISTPQRLIAKDFINRLLPYCKYQWNNAIPVNNTEKGVSVFVLEI